AAIADVDAALRFVREVPDLASSSRVDGPDMVGRREIQETVHHQRRAFDRAGAGHTQPVDPRETQVLHVAGVDLRQRAEATAGVVAVVGRPGVGGDRSLRGERAAQENRDQQDESFHLSVSRYATRSWIWVSVNRDKSSTCAANGSCFSTRTPGARRTVRY